MKIEKYSITCRLQATQQVTIDYRPKKPSKQESRRLSLVRTCKYTESRSLEETSFLLPCSPPTIIPESRFLMQQCTVFDRRHVIHLSSDTNRISSKHVNRSCHSWNDQRQGEKNIKAIWTRLNITKQGRTQCRGANYFPFSQICHGLLTSTTRNGERRADDVWN